MLNEGVKSLIEEYNYFPKNGDRRSFLLEMQVVSTFDGKE